MIKNYFIKGAIHNLDPREKTNVVYCQGVLVGIVSALRDQGMSFDEAIAKVRECLPGGYSLDAIPPYWRDLFAPF